MATYRALVTLAAVVEFEAADDAAADQYCSDRFDGHPQRVANLARLQHGWMGTDYGTIAIENADTGEVVAEV